MARLKIIPEEEPLHKKSRPITEITDRIRTLLSDMLETMRDADGVGLAAPQVGVLRRAVVISSTISLLAVIVLGATSPTLRSYCSGEIASMQIASRIR